MSLPIETFLKTKIKEYDEDFDLRDGTAFTDMYIKPTQLIMQPTRDELDQVELNQSILNILESDYPDAFPEDAVDSLMSNVFVERKLGDKTTGVARAYFQEARSIEILSGEARFSDKSGNIFLNTTDISVSQIQMELQVSGDYYYIDIPVEAEDQGAIVVEVNDIITWENAPSGVVQVGNENVFIQGVDKETNSEFIKRARNSISVRDLVTGKGINATLNENFSTIEDLQSIGLGDPEMQRDIVQNIHIGGQADVYVKTPQLNSDHYDVFSILTDQTRRKSYKSYKSLPGTEEVYLGIISIDRTNYAPIVKEIAEDTFGTFTSSVNLSGGINLSSLYNIKIATKAPDGSDVMYQIGLQGSVPSSTTRSEIIGKINSIFGFTLASAVNGGGGEEYIKFTCAIPGPEGYIYFLAPTINDATFITLGLSQAVYPHVYQGTTAKTYIENVDYEIDDNEGYVKRLSASAIGDGDLVDIQFEYNPISVDIGSPIRQYDGSYTVRPGRDDLTITNVPFIDILSIEVLDPVSGEPTGEILDAVGGFGQGGFGRGEFGIGSGSDFRIVVVQPNLRYSIYEENYIEISPNFIGRDLRVNYRHANEIKDIQAFVMTESERVVASRIVVKHFVPAFVDFSMTYNIQTSRATNLKTNQELTDLCAEAVNDFPRGIPLEVSDFVNLLYKEGAIKVELPIVFHMEIHHVDGTTEMYESNNELSVPNPELESQTDKPISPRITHFIPRDITLIRRLV